MGAPPACSCRHGRRSWASARFTCDLQWGGGVGSSLRHNFLGPSVRVCHDGVAVAIFVPHRHSRGLGWDLGNRAASPVATLLLYIRHCRRLTEANCLKCSFRLMVSYSMDRKLHRQEEFCRAMLLRCNASCVPQRCGLTISLFEDENAQEFNVVTEQSKILGFFDILEQLPTLYTKPWRTTTNRACATTGGACTVQNSAATVASQEGYIRLIRRRFHCRVPHKHIVPIKGSYGTAWMF